MSIIVSCKLNLSLDSFPLTLNVTIYCWEALGLHGDEIGLIELCLYLLFVSPFK